MVLVEKLQSIRTMLAEPVTITCGVRCPKHNAAVGGVPDSAHLVGHAADIAVPNDRYRYRILALVQLSFDRIGIYPGFIHVDNDPTKPQNVIWVEA